MPLFRISSEIIDSEKLRREMDDERAGAFVCFEGRVRNSNEGKKVLSLEYEAYRELALKEGSRVLAEAIEEFGVIDVVCVHRVGHLEIGDLAVWVGVLAAHRAEGFDACRFTIDNVKGRVPIWKRERYADGSISWVNCAECAQHTHASMHEASVKVEQSV